MPFKKISHKVQARLPFTPLSQSQSFSAPDGSSQVGEQPQMAVLIHSPSQAKKRRIVGPSQSSHSSGLDHESYFQTPGRGQSFLPTPASSSQTAPGSPALKPNLKVEILVTNPKRSDKGETSSVSKSTPLRQRHGSPSLNSDSSDDSDIVPTRSMRAARNTDMSAHLDEDNINPRLPARASKQQKRNIPLSLRRMSVTEDDTHSLLTGETVPSTRTRNKTSRARREQEKYSDEMVDQSKSPLTGNQKAPGRTGQPSSIASTCSDESSDDIVSKPPRRRPSARVVDEDARPDNGPDLVAAQHAADLQEDMEDLRENHKELQSRRKRDKRITPMKTVKQKQLEALRRRHTSKNQRGLSSSSQIAPLSTASSNNGPPESGEGGTSDEELDSGIDNIRQSLLESADEYEEDFVVNDDDGLLGAPAGLDQIPLEFTRHAHKEPIEHFKDVVEWMVHNKLNPAFARNDEIYRIAVRKLDDQVQAYAGSKSSTVWSPEFTNALKMRPEISTRAFKEVSDVCQACNRRHTARYRVTLSGKAYDRDTLEDLSDEDDEDKDEYGEWPDEAQSFFVGSTCVVNAGAAHTLNHWRIHLKSYVLHWLERRGCLTNQKILERESWNTRKREKYANTLVDKMEDTGVIRTFYNELKENRKAARATLAQEG